MSRQTVRTTRRLQASTGGGASAQAAALIGFLELLQDDGLLGDPEALRAYLSVVRGKAAELARSLSAVVEFGDSVHDAARGVASAETPRLSELVRQVAGERPVRVQVSAEAVAAMVEEDRLRLILRLLLELASQSSQGPGELLVRADMEPSRLVLEVGNTQPAVQAERLAVDASCVQRAGAESDQEFKLKVASRASELSGGSLKIVCDGSALFRLELPLWDAPLARQIRAQNEQDARAAAQVVEALQVVREQHLEALRTVTDQERRARELAEAQQMAILRDFKLEHKRAMGLADRLRGAYLETITALARAVEARDSYTGGHVERVRRYSLGIAEALNLSADGMTALEYGAVLHDVGKVGVPDAVLGKPGPLEPDEWTVMRRHPEIGRRVLEGIVFLEPTLDAVAAHHERWDGRGYPYCLSGEQIPLFGRIVAVADAYDAMVTDRPYRSGLKREQALAEIERGRGAQFDPDVAAAFLVNPPAPA